MITATRIEIVLINAGDSLVRTHWRQKLTPSIQGASRPAQKEIKSLNNPIFVIHQWAIRSVHSNRLSLVLYKALSALKVKRRVLMRALSSLSNNTDAMKSADPTITDKGLSQFVRYQTEFAELPGWFLVEAQALWDCLFCFQREHAVPGHMLEIGVWKGKSAACSSLYARPDETCVYVDRMILPEFRDTIASIRKSNNIFVQQPSYLLPGHFAIGEMGPTFRWIHIDGEHSGEAVWDDLSFAAGLLAENGVICVDDFPSCAYPQINFAVTRFLTEHPSLTMFACGHNKGYICHQQSALRYLTFFKNELHGEMRARGADVTIWKSGRASDANCFGITDRVESYDYRGPDWNPLNIEI